jgi:hypothetical protein
MSDRLGREQLPADIDRRQARRCRRGGDVAACGRRGRRVGCGVDSRLGGRGEDGRVDVDDTGIDLERRLKDLWRLKDRWRVDGRRVGWGRLPCWRRHLPLRLHELLDRRLR